MPLNMNGKGHELLAMLSSSYPHTLRMHLGTWLHQSAAFEVQESKRGKLNPETADFTFGVVLLHAQNSPEMSGLLLYNIDAHICFVLLYTSLYYTHHCLCQPY